MGIPILFFGVGAFRGWLSTIVHGAWSFAHLGGKYSRLPMLVGARSTDPESFTPRGWQLAKRGLISFAVFGACSVAAAASSFLRSSP